MNLASNVARSVVPGILVAVDADRPPEAVTNDILTRLSDLSLIGDNT